jgi:glycosyltransferase 2 family protein
MKTRWFENHLSILRVLGTALAIILLIFLLEKEGWNEVTAALKKISLSEFLLAFALLMVSRLFMIGRWHVLLRSADIQIPFLKTVSLSFTGLFATNFLPTTIGGDVVRLAGVIQMGFDRAICIASLIADRLIGMLGSTIFLPFGLIPFLQGVTPDKLQAITLPVFIQKLWVLAVETLKTFSIWAKKPRALLASLICSLGNMLFIFAALRTLIIGLHENIPFMLVAGMWSLTYFVTLVPISINGYGVQELSLSFLLARVGGLGNVESLTVAVLIRALFVFASLPGAFFLPGIMETMAKVQLKETEKK